MKEGEFMKTMITGVRPTGSITLANYIGGIRGFVEQQYKYNSLIFIADIHGLTTYIDPNEIRNNILDVTAMYMACGIDIKNTAIRFFLFVKLILLFTFFSPKGFLPSPPIKLSANFSKKSSDFSKK